ALAAPVAPNAAGQYLVTDQQPLLLKVRIAPASPQRLYVGILLCSNNGVGDILLLWPPPNAHNVLPPGDEKIVGWNGPNPFRLDVRPGQTRSLYTFKAFASDEQHPIDLTSLTLDKTVQDVVNAWFARAIGAYSTPRADVLWTTFELP